MTTSHPTADYGAPYLPITSHPKETTLSEKPARHLSDAAEGVRAFNHTSRSAVRGWQFPGDSYTALGNLSHLIQMLGQAVEQSTVPAVHMYKQGRVLIDNGGDAEAKVTELLAAREDAVAAAAALTDAVQRMHNATSPMGADTEGLVFHGDEDA